MANKPIEPLFLYTSRHLTHFINQFTCRKPWALSQIHSMFGCSVLSWVSISIVIRSHTRSLLLCSERFDTKHEAVAMWMCLVVQMQRIIQLKQIEHRCANNHSRWRCHSTRLRCHSIVAVESKWMSATDAFGGRAMNDMRFYHVFLPTSMFLQHKPNNQITMHSIIRAKCAIFALMQL